MIRGTTSVCGHLTATASMGADTPCTVTGAPGQAYTGKPFSPQLLECIQSNSSFALLTSQQLSVNPACFYSFPIIVIRQVIITLFSGKSQ